MQEEQTIQPLRDPANVGQPLPEGITPVAGGVTAAAGFKAAGVHAGFRPQPERLDFALVVADQPCSAAATFTQNVFCAAPVTVSREHLDGVSYGTARAVIINSGNANAATGAVGLQAAEQSARMAAEAVGCTANEVLVASTGVIGQHLPLEPFGPGLQLATAAAAATPEAGHSAARAIMTTDTVPKECAVTFEGESVGLPGCTFTVGGMAKGSGMIMPNMATMISVITTDAPVGAYALHEALISAVQASFNKITVDSDTSTNDTCFALASGAAAPGNTEAFAPETPAYQRFCEALRYVCTNLARQQAQDGEGATRLVTVNLSGAATPEDADLAARTVANSPLVKTAIYGHDCNWGRIAGAVGRSGARFEQLQVDIDIMGLPVCRGGLTVPFSEEEALRRFEDPEIVIDINLGAGDAATTVWTCDFSHDYVTINGDYRT
ncbi:MAG: bifunctional glutamate N-acetyltransferase/amino-acid acetyltransferase ArgJ [Coriobacteriia bacterium]|nr:bifunctional glutamate N-acetyltransferase/amino-acid acetyltransferase ArgJ [Coriobacteriia bacterium]